MILQLAVSKCLLVGAAHISFLGLGHVHVNGEKYEWIPVAYEGDPCKRYKCRREGQGL
jgi:hypothetical protein